MIRLVDDTDISGRVYPNQESNSTDLAVHLLIVLRNGAYADVYMSPDEAKALAICLNREADHVLTNIE